MKVSAGEIDTIERFSSKAAEYTRFRWGYDPRAFAQIVQTVGLTSHSVVADIGSGPGSVARYLLDSARYIYAVEPNAEMRRVASLTLGEHPALVIVPASAEATTLPDKSVDLITVGRAIHWFDPEAARAEFRRILRTAGWLAILRDDWSQSTVGQAVQALRAEEVGWSVQVSKLNLETPPLGYYFGSEDYQTWRFPFHIAETFEQFLGRQSSLSSAPNADHPLRPAFEQAAAAIFAQHSEQGLLHIDAATVLHLGRIQ